MTGKLQRRRQKSIATVKFSKKEQAKSFLLLADLLQAGFSLKHALAFITDLDPHVQKVFAIVDKQMKQGKTFANSLRPYINADLYYQLLLAEKHGNFVKTIREVGNLLMSQEKQKKKLLALLQYPVILLLMLGGLIICLVIFVFPELRTWQSENGSEVSIFSYFIAASIYISAGLLATIGFRWWQWHHLSFERRVIKLCHMPVVGKCYRYYYHYYLTSILGMMLQQGMSLNEICTLTRHFDQQSLLYLFGNAVSQKARAGETLTKVISHYSFIPNELVIFLNKGATIERIGDDLTAFSAIQFKKLTATIERLLLYVQPLIFCFIAIIIVSLYLSILLPIYHSLQGVY